MPENRSLLEEFRFLGSTNRVYRIPIDPAGDEFIIVKMRFSQAKSPLLRVKRIVKNALYGEHIPIRVKGSGHIELERGREWLREGCNVPPIIETTIPGVKVFVGLHYPTLYSILSDEKITPKRKLEIVGMVARALSLQHQNAYQKGKQSLVHGDAGPWNIMFDLNREEVYWFDLEFATSSKMTIEDFMARSVRIFIFGVLDHLWEQFDETIEVFCENYEPDFVLWRFIESLEKARSSLLGNALEKVRRGRPATVLRKRISLAMGEILERKALAAAG